MESGAGGGGEASKETRIGQLSAAITDLTPMKMTKFAQFIKLMLLSHVTSICRWLFSLLLEVFILHKKSGIDFEFISLNFIWRTLVLEHFQVNSVQSGKSLLVKVKERDTMILNLVKLKTKSLVHHQIMY